MPEDGPQFVHFSFYKLDIRWRRLLRELKEESKGEARLVLEKWAGRFAIRPYTLTGIRGDTDFLLWKIGDHVEDFRGFATSLLNTTLGGYLETPYAYLSMTKRSQYVKGEGRSMHKRGRIMWNPDSRYLLIYPMVKARAWYQLSKPARQGIMNEHIATGHKFPTVKINTTYSFGIDDQEFVVA
ncbi:MAG TPA: chlorite dismutase family protein, partial [Thermoplasmata archaeon]|nr:chlorite dismutase family protein [Thermoplasmata archaeon]